MRLISPTNASVHDLILVDSPKFHIVLDFAVNVEAYHLTIRGANLGSYDGIDAIGTNYYIHDSEVAQPCAVIIKGTRLTETARLQTEMSASLSKVLLITLWSRTLFATKLARVSQLEASTFLRKFRTSYAITYSSNSHAFDNAKFPIRKPGTSALSREMRLHLSKLTPVDLDT